MIRFFVGFFMGVLATLGVRWWGAQRYRPANIETYYQNHATNYDQTDHVVNIAGYKPRIELRKQTIRHLDLQPGDTVLDIGCGTGANFPYIQAQIGPSGRIVGVDFSQPMLDVAAQNVQQNGWENVELVQADAAELDLGQQFDAVMSVMAMVVIPDYQAAMTLAFAHLKAGGMFAISDLCESQRPYMLLFNPLVDLANSILVTDLRRRPWEMMRPWVELYRREELLLGYMYTASGRKPLQGL